MENKESSEKVDIAKDKALNFAKNGLDKSLVRSIVIRVTEFLIPIVFWIGLAVIVIFSSIVGAAPYRFSAQIAAFFTTLIPLSLAFIVSFYLLYLLKDIRDSLVNRDPKTKGDE